ncbi:MAG TPA: hypothetical protein VIU40_10790 [Geobacteraceae bacterium]
MNESRGEATTTVDFSYGGLDTMPVSARFGEKRRVLVKIPGQHARACIDFITMLRSTRGNSALRDRVKALATGLATTARITVFHPRIISLAHVVVTHDPEVRWEQLPGGEFLFHFTAPDTLPVSCNCHVKVKKPPVSED